jgi:hypothetical protein
LMIAELIRRRQFKIGQQGLYTDRELLSQPFPQSYNRLDMRASQAPIDGQSFCPSRIRRTQG